MEILNKILEELKKRKSITYEELNDLLPKEITLEEHIEEIIRFFDDHNITIESGTKPFLTDENYKKDVIIDNLIDTPDKFYFYELNKNKKISRDREQKLLTELSSVKDDIKNLLINTDFFLFALFRDITRTKPMGAVKFFHVLSGPQAESVIQDIKTRFKKYARNKKEETEKGHLISILMQLKFKFPYIIEKIKVLKNIHKEMTDPKMGDLSKIFKKVKRKKIDGPLIDHLLPELDYLLRKYNWIKELLVKNMLPAVLSIARHYFNENCNCNDLIQEGNMALIEALDYYDPESHNKQFNEFVSSRIRNQVKKYIEKNNSMMAISGSFRKECRLFLKTVRDLKNSSLNIPSLEDIKIKLNWPEKKILSVLNFLQKEESLEKEDYYTNLKIKDALPDKSRKSPEDIAIEKILKEKIIDSVNQLSEREQFIIKMRFGFNNEQKNYAYKEIAKDLGLTENEIKDIEEHSLKKLRVIFKKNDIEEMI